jgi:hypothetical protein
MRAISRVVTVGVIAAAGILGSGTASAERGAVYDVASGGGQTRAQGCWAAECGGDPKPFVLVPPICYAHEGSQYVPQCQDGFY